MHNKKPRAHSMSEQRASVSWQSHCAVNKSILLSITNLYNYSKVSKDLKQFFPLSYTACCASPVDMTQGWPRSPLLSQCYLFKTSIYSQFIWPSVLDRFATITALFPSPTFLNYTSLHLQDLSLIFSTCSDFAFIFLAHIHQSSWCFSRQVWTLNSSAR